MQFEPETVEPETVQPEIVEPEREPTPAEWEQCADALRAVGLDPEAGGPSKSGPVPSSGASARFLGRVLSIEERRSRVIGRPSRHRRFELREALAEAGHRVDSGSRWVRGLRLAWAYGSLRLRESRALRIAGVLLLIDVFAMPVMAWVSQRQLATERFEHGTFTWKSEQLVPELEVEPTVELIAEEPIEDLDRPRRR